MLWKHRWKFFENLLMARKWRNYSYKHQKSRMQLEFPQAFAEPSDKILYSLWLEGGQSFMHLLLLTGLRAVEAKSALRELRDLGLIDEEIPVLEDSINCFYQLHSLPR